MLEREEAVGADHSERLEQIEIERAETETNLADLKGRWEKERGLVSRIQELREQLESTVEDPGGEASNAEFRLIPVPDMLVTGRSL